MSGGDDPLALCVGDPEASWPREVWVPSGGCLPAPPVRGRDSVHVVDVTFPVVDMLLGMTGVTRRVR